MNEQAVLDAYNLFVQNGYKKSLDEYKKLIASNSEALNDSYKLFSNQGYKKSIDDFKVLMGVGAQPIQEPVKKKEDTVSSLEIGLSESQTKPAENNQGWLLNTVSSLDKAFYQNLIGNPIKGLGTLLEYGTSKLPGGGTGKGPISDALINFGNYFNKTIDELTPQDEEFKGSLTDQFGQAFGQVASIALTAGAGGAGGAAAKVAAPAAAGKLAPVVSAAKTLGSEIASPSAVSAGLSMGQSEFDRAKQAGATDEQAFQAFYKNAAVGSILEKIPVMQFMKRFNTASSGGLANYLKTKGVAGLTGGIEEMTTEVLQQLYANKEAQDIYNINQDLFEGVGESGGVGFGVGFLLNAMGANAKLLRQEGKVNEANIVENQIKELESRSEKGGPSSYSVNGIQLKSVSTPEGVVEQPRDIISKMIDNMDATDLSKANIQIVNDPELKLKLHDKVVSSSIKEQVRQSNPNLSEAQLDEIVGLEKELKKFEGNTTQSGKDRAAQIRSQIKTIQETPAEVATEQTLESELRAALPYDFYEQDLNSDLEWKRKIAKEFLADPKAFYEKIVENATRNLEGDPNNEISKRVLSDATNSLNIINEITNKYKANAVQEQATNEGVLRTEQPEVGLQQVGEGNQEPQVVAAGTEEVVAPEVSQEEVRLFNDKKYKVEGNSATDLETGNLVPIDLADEIINKGTPVKELATSTEIKPDAAEKTTPQVTQAAAPKAAQLSNDLKDVESTTKALSDTNYTGEVLEEIENLYLKESGGYKLFFKKAAIRAFNKSKGFSPDQKLTQDFLKSKKIDLKLLNEEFNSFVENNEKRILSEWYHDSKQRGKNSQLVDAVERIVSSRKQQEATPAIENPKAPQIAAPEQPIQETEQEIERDRLSQKVYRTKNAISRSDNTEEAIVKYNEAKKALEDFDASIEKKKDVSRAASNVQTLVEDENSFAEKPNYEFAELHQQDPRLAALARAKEMLEFSKSGDLEKSYIKQGASEEQAKIDLDRAIARDERDIADLEADLQANPVVSSKTQEVAQGTEQQVEIEQYTPLTEDQISHEKKFTKDNSIDYEEDVRETESGREVTYLSRVTVEVIDNNTGDAIGGLTKIVDEDKNVSWQVQDLDGNELGKEDFDTMKEAKAALLKNWNKIQKKEFDKEAKKKAKVAERAAAKEAKKAQTKSNKKTKLAKDEQVQPQRTGDGAGRTEVSPIEPLEGAPSVPGVNGPDPQLVAVAEEYAKENGIPFSRQAEYVKVDEDRAVRIADAYEQMAHDPKNPKVKEAYQNLIKQTIAQYNALVKAGYKFWFMDLNIPSNQEYASSPYNAIRDMRKNKEMGVFPTTDGYGDGGINELDVEDNPMLADTGIQWPVGGLDGPMKNVLANDLFRAVHDAFGHGLEGAGFRARGEENAWQAHVRLFTGSAVGAITSETRGQNSWLNFGPNGESNRNAKVEDTIFAEQKVGLMPEWTWQEGRAEDMKPKVEDTKALMTADTKDKTTLERVYNFLDKIDSDLEAFGKETAGMNIAVPVMRAIIKTVKALVGTGITLQEAIKRAAAQNNVSEQDVVDSINALAEQRMQEAKPQGVSEMELPGYNQMVRELQYVINDSRNKGQTEDEALQTALDYLQGSSVYENASDTQKEKMYRDVRKMFGKTERRAPSIGRVLEKEEKMVTVNEMAALKDQIRLEARAAREAKADLNSKRKQLADAVRRMGTDGKLSVRKVNALVNKIGRVNLDSQIAVDKFLDYASKIISDAEYSEKLSSANKMRSQIRKLSKSKDKAANLRELGAKFIDIDPSMVEDIDKYNQVASLIRESIKGSTIRGAKVDFANMVKESSAIEYINTVLEEQKKKMFDMKVAEVQALLGVDASELSYEQLVELLDKKEPLTKDNEKLVRAAINKAFDIYATLIKESIRTGKDLFSGEDVEYTENQKKVVEKFMEMDLNVLKPKLALEAVDALMNFFQNQSVAKMESVYAKYTGEQNAIKIEKKGIRATPIRKYWSKSLGRLLIEQTANLNILFERMFGGFNRGGLVEDLTGVTAMKNGKSKAQSESNNIVDRYVGRFYNSKANGQAFNTAENNIERGMVAFMMRNVVGTEAEMKSEFERRANLIKESIDALSQGNDQEVEKANLYKKVYDKIVDGSKNIDEIVSKADSKNVEAVEFWQNEWDNKYEQLSDVALGVYNKVLEKDINYNPDRYSKLSNDTGEVELSTEDMTFIFNSGNAPIYKKETGVLMSATRPESLPKSQKSGEVNRYVDLSFDNNNANSMYDALVDINTAAPIRQIEAALNSSAFKRIAPESDDRKLLENRIKLYVNNIRNKNPFSNDEFSKAVKRLNRIASIGVGQALGGVLQPIKQTIPIAMNTLINSGSLDIQSIFSQSKQDFINRSGYAIANRGIESQAQVESLNKMINDVAKSAPQKAMKLIEKANEWRLKNLLVRFDVAIARASWMTYYEQSLKKQGINTSNIDWNTHEINDEAADFAQRQVDRQQNVSDSDLAGELLSSKDVKTQLLVKVIMPFASFRMNQSARLGADLSTLMNKTSTVEDKVIAARSLTGFAAEMATFRILSTGSALLIAAAVKQILDRPDDEEKEKKKMDAIIKGQLTSMVADVFSPAPILDKIVNMGASAMLESTQSALDIDEEDKIKLYSNSKQDMFQSLGLLGIAGSQAYQLVDMATLSAGMPYKDDYGRKKYLSPQDREVLQMLIPFAIISNMGLAPSEVNSITRSTLNDAKRNASTNESGIKEEKGGTPKKMSKEYMKSYYPDMYNELYGPGSMSSEAQKLKEEMKSQFK